MAAGGRRQLLRDLLVVLLGMSGLRLDRLRQVGGFVAWAGAWLGCLAAYLVIFEYGLVLEAAARQVLSIAYAALVCVFYYGGLGLVMGTSLRGHIIRKLGAERAYRRFEAVLGVVFLNQALCQTAVMRSFETGLFAPVPPWLYCVVGGALILIAFGIKLWATMLTGLDAYYFRDMFLGRSIRTRSRESFVLSGPYRVMTNPMYGVGNLAAYGGALWYQSWPGLIVAAVMQASIFLFYGLYERPFIERNYQTRGQVRVSSHPTRTKMVSPS